MLQDGKPEFTLAITDERNIIERSFGLVKDKLSNAQLTKETMNFTAEEIISLVKDRYGISKDRQDSKYELVMSEDFANECKKQELKVLINTTDLVVCSLYKISLNGVETELRMQPNKEILLKSESGAFSSIYGSTSSDIHKTKEEWMESRYLGMVPLYIKNKANGVCTLFVLHLPNKISQDDNFNTNYDKLIAFSQDTKPNREITNIKEAISFIQKNQISEQEVQQKKAIASELDTNNKEDVIKKIQRITRNTNLNPMLIKYTLANSMEITQRDIKSSVHISEFMCSLGGDQFLQAKNRAIKKSSQSTDLLKPINNSNQSSKSSSQNKNGFKYVRNEGVNSLDYQLMDKSINPSEYQVFQMETQNFDDKKMNLGEIRQFNAIVDSIDSMHGKPRSQSTKLLNQADVFGIYAISLV